MSELYIFITWYNIRLEAIWSMGNYKTTIEYYVYIVIYISKCNFTMTETENNKTTTQIRIRWMNLFYIEGIVMLRYYFHVYIGTSILYILSFYDKFRKMKNTRNVRWRGSNMIYCFKTTQCRVRKPKPLIWKWKHKLNIYVWKWKTFIYSYCLYI